MRAGVARGQHRGLVDEVGEVGAGHATGAAGDHRQVHLRREGLAAGVQRQDGFALHQGRAADLHATVEAAGAEQGGIEGFGQVGRGDDDHARAPVQPVHAGEELRHGLRVLAVAAGAAGHARLRQGVALGEEQDAGRGPARVLE